MSWGTSTNFMLAIEKILKALVDADVPPKEVRNLIVACFSDMQFDNHYANGNIFDTAEEKIGTMFALAGLKTSHRRAYDLLLISFSGILEKQMDFLLQRLVKMLLI